jgi:hypothetical protein
MTSQDRTFRSPVTRTLETIPADDASTVRAINAANAQRDAEEAALVQEAREARIQEWIDRASSFTAVTHNDPRGRAGTSFYLQTPGRSVTFLAAESGPAAERHARPVRMATTTSSPFNVSRAQAAKIIREAKAAGQEVTCKRYFYRHTDGPIRVAYERP